MKLIVATIRPERLEAVQEALDEPGVAVVAVGQTVDPREPCSRSFYRGLPIRIPRPRLRIEVVVVNEALVRPVTDAIARAGCMRGADRLGDGEILVTTLDEHVRIADRARAQSLPDEVESAPTRPPLDLGRMRQ